MQVGLQYRFFILLIINKHIFYLRKLNKEPGIDL